MIRDLQEHAVSFELSVEQDDTPVRGNALASGDDEQDRACEDEILRRLNQGDVWAWAVVRVTARWEGFEASDYLGACCYADEEEFRKDACFADMKAEALRSLNAELRANEETLAMLRVVCDCSCLPCICKPEVSS